LEPVSNNQSKTGVDGLDVEEISVTGPPGAGLKICAQSLSRVREVGVRKSRQA